MKKIFLKFVILCLLSVCNFTAYGQQLVPSNNVYVSKGIAKADSLLMIINDLYTKEKFADADSILEECITLYKNEDKGETTNYSQALFCKGLRQLSTDNPLQAEATLKECYRIWTKNMVMTTEFDHDILYYLTKTCKDNENIADALKYSNLLVIKTGRYFKRTSDEYTQALYLQGQCFLANNDFASAGNAFRNYISIKFNSETFNPDSYRDMYAVVATGDCSLQLGNYEDANQIYMLADSLMSSNDKYHKSRITILHKLSTVSMYLQDKESFEKYNNEAAEMTEKYDDDNENQWIVNLNNYANSILAEHPDSAASLFHAIVSRLEETQQTESKLYSLTVCNLGYCLYLMGYPADALECYKKGMPYFEDHSLSNPQQYFETRIMQLIADNSLGNRESVEENSITISKFLSQRICSTFSKMTETDRATIWKSMAEWYSFTLPNMAMKYQSEELLRLAYNGVLQSRGILLNSSLNIDRILKQTNNEQLNELKKQREYAKEYKQTRIQNDIERRILSLLPKQTNFMSDMSINIDSVRHNLNDGDMAIEFISVENLDDNDTTYIALVLKNSYSTPHLYKVCTNTDLNSLRENGQLVLLGDKLYDVIWKQLVKSELKHATRIYFAADGLLHTIPIEYCMMPNKKSFYDNYECYRVSSTREIAKKHSPFTPQTATIYGDINYNTSFDELKNVNTKYNDIDKRAERGHLSYIRGAVQSPSFQGLKWTREEMDSIYDIMNKAKLIVITESGKNATEESVYHISQKPQNILHFATHGFYFKPETQPEFRFLASDSVNTEQDALSHSALVMSGANTTLESDTIPSDLNDGFLTAYEISTLDLTQTDFVVLSACESGLGSINSEGVFGLQRGFKKAGVNSILMSLSNVNDYTTMIYMTEFYKSYVNDGNKRNAIKNAQNKIRTIDGGKWNNPRYWAPFILLDAM